jgi:hypothetical protein
MEGKPGGTNTDLQNRKGNLFAELLLVGANEDWVEGFR